MSACQYYSPTLEKKKAYIVHIFLFRTEFLQHSYQSHVTEDSEVRHFYCTIYLNSGHFLFKQKLEGFLLRISHCHYSRTLFAHRDPGL